MTNCQKTMKIRHKIIKRQEVVTDLWSANRPVFWAWFFFQLHRRSDKWRPKWWAHNSTQLVGEKGFVGFRPNRPFGTLCVRTVRHPDRIFPLIGDPTRKISSPRPINNQKSFIFNWIFTSFFSILTACCSSSSICPANMLNLFNEELFGLLKNHWHSDFNCP